MSRVPFVVLLTASMFLSPACVSFKDTVKQKTQTIQVTSKPSGALISVRDEDGSRTVGHTPTELSASYRVVERTYNKAACAMNGSALAADAVTKGNGRHAEADAVLGLLALVAGAAIGAAACEDADGVISVEGSYMGVRAELAGYQPELIYVQIPKESPSIHFELRTHDPNLVSSAHTSGSEALVGPAPPSQDVEATLAVFDIIDTSDTIEIELLEDVSHVMKVMLEETSVPALAVLDAEAKIPDLGDTTLVGFADRLAIARKHGAGFILDVRLARAGDTCYLSASVARSSNGERRLISSLQTTCDEDGLFDAAEKIADLINYPPQNAAETPDTPAGD